MTAVVSTELFKLRTIRTPWAIAATVLVLAAAIVAANAALLGDPGQPAATPSVLGDLSRAPGMLVATAALLLGLILSTAEYRHGTAITSRLGNPRVPALFAGKAIAAAAAGVVLALLTEVVLLLGCAAILVSHDAPVQLLRHGVPAAVASCVLIAALYGIAGVAIGELLRNPALAVGGVLGWAFVVEGILPVVLREPQLDRWLPTTATRSALSLGWPTDETMLHPVAGVSIVVGSAAALVCAGLLRAARTDP
jgi:ABC-2 type transport system permease protein